MSSGQEPTAGRCAKWSQLLVFFGLLFFLLWKEVDLRIVHHGGGVIANLPAFYWGKDFFLERLHLPGGLLNYLSALLIQSFYHSWLGALVVTGQAALIYSLLRGCLKTVGITGFRLWALAPGILLLGVYARLTLSVGAMHTSCCLVAALTTALLLGRMGPRRTILRCIAMVLGSGLLYCVSPGSSSLFFLVALTLELCQRRFVSAAAVAAALTLVPMIGFLGYGLTFQESFAATVPFTVSTRIFHSPGLAVLSSAYFFAVPLCVIGWGWARLKGGRQPTPPSSAAPGGTKGAAKGEPVHSPHENSKGGHSPRLGKLQEQAPSAASKLFPVLRWAGECLALVAVTWGVWWASTDPETRAVLRVDYYAYQRDWGRVIQAARGNPNSIHVQCAVNQALFHLGRLGDDLALGQNPEALLLYDHRFRPDWNVIDIYLDLGFVAMAHHYLAEAMDIYGERPTLLRRSALVNVALGNVGTARIYLRALAKVPFQGPWARAFLQELQADPSGGSNKEVARLRGLMMKRDQMVPLPIDRLMLSLLEVNPRNRMAFEYLMAYYLMTKDLKGFMNQLGRLEVFSFGELPRLYQEAIVLAVRDLGIRADLSKVRLGNDVIERHRQFALRLRGAQVQGQGQTELQKEFANSYFYYFFSK